MIAIAVLGIAFAITLQVKYLFWNIHRFHQSRKMPARSWP